MIPGWAIAYLVLLALIAIGGLATARRAGVPWWLAALRVAAIAVFAAGIVFFFQRSGAGTLYAGLLVLSALGGAALIPQSVYDGSVGHAPALADYLKLGCLAATIATLAGALGSLIESDESVREAAYRHHADARTEGNDDER